MARAGEVRIPMRQGSVTVAVLRQEARPPSEFNVFQQDKSGVEPQSCRRRLRGVGSFLPFSQWASVHGGLRNMPRIGSRTSLRHAFGAQKTPRRMYDLSIAFIYESNMNIHTKRLISRMPSGIGHVSLILLFSFSFQFNSVQFSSVQFGSVRLPIRSCSDLLLATLVVLTRMVKKALKIHRKAAARIFMKADSTN